MIATATHEEVRQEMGRRVSNREALTAVMSDGNWHTNAELTQVGGMRFGARILEIRKFSAVHRRDDGGGQWSFRLDSTKARSPGCDCPHCEICPSASVGTTDAPSGGLRSTGRLPAGYRGTSPTSPAPERASLDAPPPVPRPLRQEAERLVCGCGQTTTFVTCDNCGARHCRAPGHAIERCCP